MAEIAILAAFPLLMLGAGIGDVMTYKIPNWLTALIGLMFFPAAFYAGMPMAEMGWHLAGAAIVLVCCFILFCFGQFGGGDAKLLTVAGLWIGFSWLMAFLVTVAILGGILALLMQLWWAVKLQFEAAGIKAISDKVKSSIDLPYGIAIAGGAIFTFNNSWIYKALAPAAGL